MGTPTLSPHLVLDVSLRFLAYRNCGSPLSIFVPTNVAKSRLNVPTFTGWRVLSLSFHFWWGLDYKGCGTKILLNIGLSDGKGVLNSCCKIGGDSSPTDLGDTPSIPPPYYETVCGAPRHCRRLLKKCLLLKIPGSAHAPPPMEVNKIITYWSTFLDSRRQFFFFPYPLLDYFVIVFPLWKFIKIYYFF